MGWFERQLEGRNIDPQTIDYTSHWDSALNYQENKAILNKILDKIPMSMEDLDKKYLEEEQYSELQQEHVRAEEENIDQEFRESITEMKYTSKAIKVKPLEDMKFFIKMVLEGHGNGVFIKSRGGLGKTTTVYMAISELELSEDSYEYVSGHLTKTELFKKLHDNREKVIIFDDVSTISNKEIVSLLKNVLWGANGKRYVQYNSPTKMLENYPSKFEFTGQIIVCSNDFQNFDSADNRALFSRVHYLNLQITRTELREMLKKKAEQDGILKETDFNALMEYLIDVEDELLDVDLRTLDKAYDIFKYCKQTGVNWKDRLETLIIVDDRIGAYKDARMLYPDDVGKQIKEFNKICGYSRAEFFRVKRRFVKNDKRRR